MTLLLPIPTTVYLFVFFFFSLFLYFSRGASSHRRNLRTNKVAQSTDRSDDVHGVGGNAVSPLKAMKKQLNAMKTDRSQLVVPKTSDGPGRPSEKVVSTVEHFHIPIFDEYSNTKK
jgi:hypothetical protein